MGFRLKKRMGFQLPDRPYRWRGKATLILLNYKPLTRPNPAITFPKGRPRNASGREKLSCRHPRSSAGPRRPTYPSRPWGSSYFLASRSLNRSPDRSPNRLLPIASSFDGALADTCLPTRPQTRIFPGGIRRIVERFQRKERTGTFQSSWGVATRLELWSAFSAKKGLGRSKRPGALPPG